MTQMAINYGKVLYELSIGAKDVEATREAFDSCAELMEVFNSPIVKLEEKHSLVEDIFPKAMGNFMKVLCDNDNVYLIYDILEAYYNYADIKKGVLVAKLRYKNKPTDDQMQKIESFVKHRYSVDKVRLVSEYDGKMLGGFKLYVKYHEYDWSIMGRLSQLENKLTGR